MKHWKDSMDDMTFEGMDEVLSRIETDQKRANTFLFKINDFLNYEIAIPVAPVVGVAAAFLIALTLNFRTATSNETTYKITVINQWGQYENY